MKNQSPLLENILYFFFWITLGCLLYYLDNYIIGDNFTEGLYTAAATFLGFLLWLIYFGSKKKHYKIIFHVTLVSVFVLTAYWATAVVGAFVFFIPDGKWKGLPF